MSMELRNLDSKCLDIGNLIYHINETTKKEVNIRV